MKKKKKRGGLVAVQVLRNQWPARTCEHFLRSFVSGKKAPRENIDLNEVEV